MIVSYTHTAVAAASVGERERRAINRGSTTTIIEAVATTTATNTARTMMTTTGEAHIFPFVYFLGFAISARLRASERACVWEEETFF